MTPLRDDNMYAELESKPANEDADIAEIVRTILITQKQNAAAQKKPLERGTHAKGTAVHAEFEVLDVAVDRDPAMAKRLARGIYAHPGVYPAVVRFANAESREYPDSHPDLRAISFHVDVPAGVLGPNAQRLDFSAQTATTFTINNVHSFAVLMRVLAAVGARQKLKVLWSLSARDLLGLFATLGRAVKQQRGTAKLPYQQLRYWSTVPFRHGMEDAVKYSVTGSPANEGHVDWNHPNGLREDLIRHVNHDEKMAEFEFGLQFLDTEAMTRFARKHGAPYWVENAAVEWNEDQAPFHTVAHLRLLPKSVLTPEETAAQHIDVTTNSLPDTRPIGGINRARWAAESASFAARRGADVDLPPEVPLPRRSFVGNLARVAVVGFAFAFAAWWLAGVYYDWHVPENVPPLEVVDNYRYLDQGWTTTMDSPGRELYYYTAQGAPLLGIRYSWLLNFERPFHSDRLMDPDHMRQLNFIVDPIPTRSNPDHLPVGIARRFDDVLQDYVVDVTCAACHTGQLHFTSPAKGAGQKPVTTAIRIDGGQAMIAFTDAKPGSFLMETLVSLIETSVNPLKFNRFANKVLGPDATLENKVRLWSDLVGVLSNASKRQSFFPHWYPTQEGYGRTDAIARISNVVFGDHMSPANYRVARGPSSYPYLWNIWKFDWEQYGAFVAQPMARNIGEALGTGAEYKLVDDYGRPVPVAERYRTTFSFDNAQRIETNLQTLLPPPWPSDLFGNIDLAKAKLGRKLFEDRCIFCHGPKVSAAPMVRAVAPGRLEPPVPLWEIEAKPLAEIGTDPQSAMDLAGFRLDASATGLELTDVQRILTQQLEQQKTRAVVLKQHVDQLIADAAKLPKGSPARDAAEKQIQKDFGGASDWPQAIDQQIAALKKLDLRALSIGEGLNILGLVIREKYYAENHFSPEAQACFNGFDMLDIPAANLGYKPRPLEGVWATPPFLHNGSVPTIYHLLSAVGERPKHFYLGRREYDPVRLGYVTPVDPEDDPRPPTGQPVNTPAPVRPRPGEFRFDTTVAGNWNVGHEFGDGYRPWDSSKPVETNYQNGLIGPRLREDEKMQLVEYLKIHRDDLNVIDYLEKNNGAYPTPVAPKPPDCFALLNKH